MKLIRECRWGLPKSFKTGAVVGSYPKPMLVFVFDRGGLDVVPSKGATLPPGYVPMDTNQDEVITLKPRELGPKLDYAFASKVTAIDYTSSHIAALTGDFVPTANSTPFLAFLDDYNAICSRVGQGKDLPWKTIVLDSASGFSDVILSHISSVNSKSFSDARVWASMVGAKLRQTILSFTTLPCHVVIIMHSQLEKDELVGTIKELPKLYSGLRDDVGALFSQFFYATMRAGRPKLWTVDQQYVRGIGPRWPVGLAPEIDPDFQSIYGKELI